MPTGVLPTTCPVEQIYLMGNPLLTRPLRPEDVKPRLLGHWGTTPGLNLLYCSPACSSAERAVRERESGG
jgi:xylulose-5-phosphate/fructose-6-phosphate phosphoketolase